MKQIVFGIAAMLVSAPALAEQPTRLDMTQTAQANSATGQNFHANSPCVSELRQSVSQIPTTLSRADRADLRQLRDAMIVFAQRGNEEGCRAVGREIQRIVQTASTAAPSQVDATRRQQLAGARPMMDTGPVRVGDFLDNDLVSQDGEEIGEVSDVILVPGQQMNGYLLVDRDQGWLDATEELVAIPLHALRSTEGDELVVGMSEEAFNKLPAIDDDRISETSMYDGINQQWDQQNR